MRGGLASVADGLLLLLGHILDFGGDPGYGTVLGGSLALTAHIALVFALVALCTAQAERSGLPGSLRMVLGMTGTTLVSGMVLVEIAGASGAEANAVLGADLRSGAMRFAARHGRVAKQATNVARWRVWRLITSPGWAGWRPCWATCCSWRGLS